MLSKSEKQFVRYWQEQKEGPKWKYYLQYIFAWTTVIFLALLFIVKLFMADRSMGGWTSFFIIFPSSLLFAFIITHLVYNINEKKLKKITERERSLQNENKPGI